MSVLPPILVKVGGSVISALAGVATGVTFMLLLGWQDWKVCLLPIASLATPVWALVLLPLHVLLPRSSPFWHPAASAGAGGAIGAVLLTVCFLFGLAGVLWLFLPIGVLVGVVTGLVGSALARFYAARGT